MRKIIATLVQVAGIAALVAAGFMVATVLGVAALGVGLVVVGWVVG